MEQMDELRRPEANTRLLYKVVCGASGAAILAIIVYAVATSALAGWSLSDMGRSLVDVSFPLPNFAQPVAYLSVASVTFFYTGIRLWQNKVAQWSRAKLASLQLLAIVVAFASAYEVLYNFALWGSYFSVQVLYNSLASKSSFLTSPSPPPWTLIFSTWIFAAFFVVGAYSVYFLRKIHQVRGTSDVL